MTLLTKTGASTRKYPVTPAGFPTAVVFCKHHSTSSLLWVVASTLWTRSVGVTHKHEKVHVFFRGVAGGNGRFEGVRVQEKVHEKVHEKMQSEWGPAWEKSGMGFGRLV